MKVLYQWSLTDPEDWSEVDSSEWINLLKKPVPTGLDVVGTSEGWIHQINCQGIILAGFDHYAIEHGNPLKVICWSDDAGDEPVSYFHAREWFLYNLEFDSRLGIYNTKQHQIFYSASGPNNPPSQNTEYKFWTDFISPDESITRHGIWTTDELDVEHRDITNKNQKGWQSWTDGVPVEYIRDGVVQI